MSIMSNDLGCVLWFSNYRFSVEDSGGSGFWVGAMASALKERFGLSICNVTLGPVSSPVVEIVSGVRQLVLPIRAVARRRMCELPPRKLIDAIVAFTSSVNPNLIHIWGTERFWPILTAKRMLPSTCPVLLELQGLTSEIAPYLTYGLSRWELVRCVRLKECLRPCLSMSGIKRQYERSRIVEDFVISAHANVSAPSKWLRQKVPSGHRVFESRIVLRREFMAAEQWKHHKGHIVFSSCGWHANKGLYTLVKACALLKMKFPDLQLIVAGDSQVGIRRSGFEKFIRGRAATLNLGLVVLGTINARNMISHLQEANVYVNPSYMESYSVSLAEAMAVGCPCVASRVGAMPEVGGNTCMYFERGDYIQCAQWIEAIFDRPELAVRLGRVARERSLMTHDPVAGASRQMEIYKTIGGGV